jgi:hypothetical protein
MTTSNSLSAEMRFLIDKELESDEVIVWTGRPQALMYAKRFWIISLFFVIWTTFSIFLLSLMGKKLLLGLAEQNMKAIIASGVMIVFLLIGILGMLIPYFVYRRTKKNLYVLTNRRALIVRDISPGRIKLTDLAFRRLQSPTRVSSRQRKDGYGDIIFERITRYDGERIRVDETAFYSLSNVSNVEREINFLWK